jgi:CheY-like chemotaxis protein
MPGVTAALGRSAGLTVDEFFAMVDPTLTWAALEEFIAAAPLPVLPSGKGRVLVVEDDPAVRDSLLRMLHRLGYDPTPADNGVTALRMLEDERLPVLVLSDILMPNGMSGLELARTIADRWPHLPVVLMSGYHDESEQVPPGVRKLLKPFSQESLATLLADMALPDRSAPAS